MNIFTKTMKVLAGILLVGMANFSNAQCNASFTYSDNGFGVFTFSSTSTGTVANTPFTWNFGYPSGTGTGSIANAFFPGNGNYVVTLVVGSTVSPCFSTIQQTVSVTTMSINNCALNANFYIASQNQSNIFTMVNNSTGTVAGTTYLWDFGDGNTSTAAQPVHTYTTNGLYNVKLLANNNYSIGSCADSSYSLIKVCSSLITTISYSYGPNGQLNLYSPSTGTNVLTTYTWNVNGINSSFNVQSSLANPSFTLFNGSYQLVLFASNGSSCTVSSIINSGVTVTNNPCVANTNFTLVPTATAQVWNAIPGNTANVVAATWNWGDNSTSNTLYTSHTYSASGTYSICLSTTLSCGSSTTFCSSYFIFRASSAQSQQMIKVNVVAAGSVGLTNYNADAAVYNVYPNPNNGSFSLDVSGLSGIRSTITVSDLYGKTVYTAENEVMNGQLKKEVDLDQLGSGIYILQINCDGNQHTQKLMITK